MDEDVPSVVEDGLTMPPASFQATAAPSDPIGSHWGILRKSSRFPRHPISSLRRQPEHPHVPYTQFLMSWRCSAKRPLFPAPASPSHTGAFPAAGPPLPPGPGSGNCPPGAAALICCPQPSPPCSGRSRRESARSRCCGAPTGPPRSRSCPRTPIMGNCIPVSPSLLESRSSLLDLMELMGNFSSYDDDDDSNETSLDYGAAPCHNQYCSSFQRVAPPFLAVTSATAVLGTAALLLALAKQPQWPQSRALVAQLAMGTGLFAAVLPAVALGIGQGWQLGTALCRLMHLLWYWSLFAQGLLVASGSCGRFWCRWDARSRRLAVALWALALLLATPAALTSGTMAVPEPSCLRRSVDLMSPVNLLHLSLCLCLFLLLPVAVPMAMLAVPRWRARWAPDLAASWVFLALWVPHGAALATELLLHSQVLPQTCGTFQNFDYALGLSEALGVLHCWMGPAAVLLAARLCRAGTGTGPSPHSIAPTP